MLKKQRTSLYVVSVAAILAVVALILFFVTNSTVSYEILNSQRAILCLIAAIAACAVSVFAQIKNVNELIVSALRLTSLGLIMVAFTTTLIDRAVVAGGLFTWNGLDTYAWRAFYTGIACIVFQILSAILLVVSGCMKQGISGSNNQQDF